MRSKAWLAAGGVVVVVTAGIMLTRTRQPQEAPASGGATPRAVLPAEESDKRDAWSVGPVAAVAPEAETVDEDDDAPTPGTFAALPEAQKKAILASRRKAALFRAERLKVAQTYSRESGRCANGDHDACASLTGPKSTERQKLVASVRDDLRQRCDRDDANACLHLGDLDALAGAGGAAWYDKARAIATTKHDAAVLRKVAKRTASPETR